MSKARWIFPLVVLSLAFVGWESYLAMKNTLDIPVPVLRGDGTVAVGWAKRTQPSLFAFILRQTQREVAPGQPIFVRDYRNDTDNPGEAGVLTSVLSSQPDDLLVRHCLNAGTRVDQGVKRPYGPHGTFNGYQWAYLYRRKADGSPGDGSVEAAEIAAGTPDPFDKARFAGDAGPLYPFVQKNLPFEIGTVFFTGQLTPDAASLSLGCGYTPQCGNALLDSGEGCDDGCFAEGTSRGNLPPGCDAAPLSAGDGCGTTCQFEACGNGILDPGEQCDDGNSDETDACLNTCVTNGCGDGHKLVSGPTPEGCDDGFTTFNAATNRYEWCYAASPTCLVQGNDGCTASCSLEAGYTDEVKPDPIGNPVNPAQAKRSVPVLVIPGL